MGPEHPDVASALNGLAELYRLEKRYSEAEPLYQRALSIREKSLGHDHPDVAQSLEGLSALYRQSSRLDEAEALDQRAETIRAIPR